MKHRAILAVLVIPALILFLSSANGGDKDKNVHEGKLVSVKGTEFTMTMKDTKSEHTHKLAATAKVIGLDGKECRLDDLKSGQWLRVTTKEGDKTVAMRVEAIKKE